MSSQKTDLYLSYEIPPDADPVDEDQPWQPHGPDKWVYYTPLSPLLGINKGVNVYVTYSCEADLYNSRVVEIQTLDRDGWEGTVVYHSRFCQQLEEAQTRAYQYFHENFKNVNTRPSRVCFDIERTHVQEVQFSLEL